MSGLGVLAIEDPNRDVRRTIIEAEMEGPRHCEHVRWRALRKDYGPKSSAYGRLRELDEGGMVPRPGR